ncbi:hypothetical protein QVD17_01913 [Tagetes erecta]|uniref:Uncharacterized protein n=1 Tax=Tagetes erecta TaxID=13708 RepID=A0AAD8LCZ9_TARER|nr:hypothetical protein QVD17_01913 [Tagetes erecta]
MAAGLNSGGSFPAKKCISFTFSRQSHLPKIQYSRLSSPLIQQQSFKSLKFCIVIFEGLKPRSITFNRRRFC